MFVGHLSVALAAKKVEPQLPLPALVTAAFALDMLWPIFLLAGWETVRIDPGNTPFTPFDFVSYPWSHSLLMVIGWGALAGWIAARVGTPRMGLVIASLVVSHWLLDFVSHRPDMPLWPDGPRLGLGLWYSIPLTIAVEGAMLAASLAIYVRASPARDRIGSVALWSLVALVTAIWISGPFSPPPPTEQIIGITGLAGAALFTAWSWWVQRHRQ